ncbi:hypothetical protein D3C86_1829030 [compost metagenome]
MVGTASFTNLDLQVTISCGDREELLNAAENACEVREFLDLGISRIDRDIPRIVLELSLCRQQRRTHETELCSVLAAFCGELKLFRSINTSIFLALDVDLRTICLVRGVVQKTLEHTQVTHTELTLEGWFRLL